MRTKRTIGVIVAAVLTASLTVGDWPSPGEATAQSRPSESIDPAVKFYALDYSVSTQEARRRLDRIQPLQAVMASIRAHEGPRVAGWDIDHAPDLKGWVWLTGDQPAGKEAASIADGAADVEIRTGAAHTHAQLLAAQDRFGDGGAVAQVIEGPGSRSRISDIVTFTSVNMKTNGIEIGIDPDLAIGTRPGGVGPGETGTTTTGSVSEETLRTTTTWLTGILQDHINVKFAVVDGRGVGSAASFVGGDSMRTCTAGFAAREPGGAYGIITAGHCSNNQRMRGVALPHVYGWESVTADAQFHKIPTNPFGSHRLLDDYICNSYLPITSQCDVTGDRARNDMMGEYVCHIGRRSGTSCGTVTDITYRPTYDGACKAWANDNNDGPNMMCSSVFVKVDGPSLKSCGGDSGGPWYRSGVAYGITMGTLGIAGCNRRGQAAFFSAIRYVERFLNVQVLTSPATIN